MKFKYIIRILLLILFAVLLVLTITSIVREPSSGKLVDFGSLSSIQNDVKMIAKMQYDPENNEIIVKATAETYQQPDLISDTFFADAFLSSNTGSSLPVIRLETEVLSDYQVRGTLVFSYTEPAQVMTLHLFDIEERKFNFSVPPQFAHPKPK